MIGTARLVNIGYSINLEIIEKACNLKNTDDTEMMWKFIENVNDAKIGYLEVDDYDIGFPLRLTLDYKEDYWIMCSILKMLSKFPSRIEILELFTANPDLYKVNWFRNDEYLESINNFIDEID